MDLRPVPKSDSRYNREGASGDGRSHGTSGLRWRCRSLRRRMQTVWVSADRPVWTGPLRTLEHTYMILHVAKASHRVYVFRTQAPNGDFDNLYLDMNGRSAMAGSMVHCKDNAFTQALCKVRTDPTLMDMVQELFTRAAIQKMVPRQWTRNTCILTTASQLVSSYEGIFSQQIQCHGHRLVCIQQSRYENIFLYLDRLFRIVRLHFMTLKLSINTGMSVALTRTARPKRLVYMAIDGVAPRTLLRLYKLLLETVSVIWQRMAFKGYSSWFEPCLLEEPRWTSSVLGGSELHRWDYFAGCRCSCGGVHFSIHSGARRDGERTGEASAGLGGSEFFSSFSSFLSRFKFRKIVAGRRSYIAQPNFRQGIWFQCLQLSKWAVVDGKIGVLKPACGCFGCKVITPGTNFLHKMSEASMSVSEWLSAPAKGSHFGHYLSIITFFGLTSLQFWGGNPILHPWPCQS